MGGLIPYPYRVQMHKGRMERHVGAQWEQSVNLTNNFAIAIQRSKEIKLKTEYEVDRPRWLRITSLRVPTLTRSPAYTPGENRMRHTTASAGQCYAYVVDRSGSRFSLRAFRLRGGAYGTSVAQRGAAAKKKKKLPATICATVQRYEENTTRHARMSDEALGVRVTLARIAPSLLDLGRYPLTHFPAAAVLAIFLGPVLTCDISLVEKPNIFVRLLFQSPVCSTSVPSRTSCPDAESKWRVVVLLPLLCSSELEFLGYTAGNYDTRFGAHSTPSSSDDINFGNEIASDAPLQSEDRRDESVLLALLPVGTTAHAAVCPRWKLFGTREDNVQQPLYAIAHEHRAELRVLQRHCKKLERERVQRRESKSHVAAT
ncbi:hypothetical protein PR048_023972 [Dryococelus australis]|uniref:Uncharacterized protein n=1 Tax=Dryococelus australis TaxID=614101 RepID=A0ABQ9GVK5_9NEOP|nr:hypothetical protein PR048_023972 [Dryococelus australis]